MFCWDVISICSSLVNLLYLGASQLHLVYLKSYYVLQFWWQVSTVISSNIYIYFPEDLTPSIMAARPSMALALGQQQVAGLARAATLEQLREKLETGGGMEGPERKMARLAEEQQRLMQQAFQHNLLAMASQMPMNMRLGAPPITTRGQCHQAVSEVEDCTFSFQIKTNRNFRFNILLACYMNS